MDYENMEFCQSCMMPLSSQLYGTENDGSKNKDYCIYCYENGNFTSDMTMEEMIEFCVPKTVEATGMSEEEARKMSEEYFPKLKRWKK